MACYFDARELGLIQKKVDTVRKGYSMKRFIFPLLAVVLSGSAAAGIPTTVTVRNNTPYEVQVWLEYGNQGELKGMSKVEYKRRVGMSEKIMVPGYKSEKVRLRSVNRASVSSDTIVALKARPCKRDDDGIVLGAKTERYFDKGSIKEHYVLELEDGMIVPHTETPIEDDLYAPSAFEF